MWRKLALLACLAVSASAQDAISNATSGPWTAELDGVWRWHEGDDMRWAAPTFDDSSWPQLKNPGTPPDAPSYWIRIPVLLGKMSDPGIMIGPFGYAYELYFDGQHIGNFGDLSRGNWSVPRWQIFYLPRNLTAPGTHAVAIRLGLIGRGFTRSPRLAPDDNRVGEFSALHEAESAHMRADLRARLLQLLIDFGFLLAGIYFLLLPPTVSQGTAFRWLGVILSTRAVMVLGEFYANDAPLNLPGNFWLALAWTLIPLQSIACIEFPYALFRRRVPLALRCFECLLAALAAPVPFPYSAVIVRFSIFLIPRGVIPVVLAATELRKRTASAALILVLFTMWGTATLSILLFIGYHVRLPTTIDIAGFRLPFWDAALLLWVAALTIQIHKANLRFRDEQQRLRGEMEAARHVQQVLLPSRAIQVPGFQIDADYHPAMEVGGDFFQLFLSSARRETSP